MVYLLTKRRSRCRFSSGIICSNRGHSAQCRFRAGTNYRQITDTANHNGLGNDHGHCYDLTQKNLFSPTETPIVDPVQVLVKALHIGVSGALMAVTTEVLVHRPRDDRDEDVDLKI